MHSIRFDADDRAPLDRPCHRITPKPYTEGGLQMDRKGILGKANYGHIPGLLRFCSDLGKVLVRFRLDLV